MNITVIRGGDRFTIQAEAGESLLEVLNRAGVEIAAACGGMGKCGKCKVKVNAPVETSSPIEAGYALACRSYIIGDVEVTVPDTAGGGLTIASDKAGSRSGSNIGVALDVGTTTLAAALCDLDSGTVIGCESCQNPQRGYGADVISRIAAAGEGKLSAMQSVIISRTNEMIDTLLTRYGYDSKSTSVKAIAVCGNTTMMHIYAGADPTPLGQYPFTPVFTDMKTMSGAELGVNAEKIILLPSASAYIGSDVMCGLLSTGMCDGDAPRLLIDIGTNGEMALVHHGKLICTSAAAGPALEGACISCGVGGITGAVDHITYDEDNKCLSYTTIGSAEPVGVCGCGLVDLIALLIEHGVIDETGSLEDGEGAFTVNDDDSFTITQNPPLSLTGGDVRQFQLAKSALSTAASLLISEASLSPSDLEAVYIAGGLGYYMREDAMLRSGVLPTELRGLLRVVGNSALSGAVFALCDENARIKLQKTAERAEIIELNELEEFMDMYVENMMFNS